MFIIGITGGIGCGKSTVANICRDYGLPVIDADEISREVTSVGGAAISEIAESFGIHIIGQDGSLDREKMAEIVFGDRKSLDKLSRIVHRHVIEQIKIRTAKFKEEKSKALVLDVPIPVKDGFLDLCDQVWLIWTDDDLRIKRLNERGMGTEEARRRISFQMTRNDYESLSQVVIDNNGTEEELITKVRETLDEQLHMRGIKY
ncbi:MAG: dephospho-CoA kinase [Eubacteriales bacterium]|nr:dephospho-CoA kinase [Eubacteriales bacterium]MDD4717170.1 dephospho-CoA kinase [Eubacteriales bacterium]